MRNILLTGGAGFIGTHLVDLLIDKGFNVIVLDALSYAAQPQFLPKNKCHLIHGSIQNAELVTHLLHNYDIDTVINAAAESHVDRSIVDAQAFIQTNIIGTTVLLQCVQKFMETQKKFHRFLQVSTDEVYGHLTDSTGLFDEKTPTAPRSPYSASKTSADNLAMAWYHTYGVPVTITRCSNNFGPRQHREKLIPNTVFQAIQGNPIPVYGKGLNIRDWMYVRDHCYGIYLALTKGIQGDIYCFGGECEIENIVLVKKICLLLDEIAPKETPYQSLITFVEDRLGHDFRYGIDNSYVVKTLGFNPSKQFDRHLKETVQWFVSHFTEKEKQ